MKKKPRDFRTADDLLKFYTDQILRVEERISDLDDEKWRAEQNARLCDRRADLERQRDIVMGLHQIAAKVEQLELPEHDGATGEVATTPREFADRVASLLDTHGVKYERNVRVGGRTA